jgi:hypothetical protein
MKGERMPFASFFKLKKQFADSLAPEPEELRGYYAVRLLPGFLPPLRFFGHRKFFPADAARPEAGSGGFNEFLGKICIGSFIIEPADSALGDGQRVLRINYDRPGNPFWLRILNDELKKTGDGRYLGRGVLRLFGLAFNSFYFSVERENRGNPEKNSLLSREAEKKTPDANPRVSHKLRPAVRGRDEAVFNKVADTIIPRGGVYTIGAADYNLIPRVNEYLKTTAPVLRRLTPVMLRYVEWASLIFNGRRFTRLSRSRAERFLERMETGRFLYHRHMILFLKLLIMMAFYEQKIPAESIGYVHGCHLHAEDGETI